AVGVAAVLLAGGGVTYALTDHSGTTSGGLADGAPESESPGGSEQFPTDGKTSGAKKPADAEPSGQGGEKAPKTEAKKPSAKGGEGKDESGSGDSGDDGGSDDGASGSTGGSGEGSAPGGSGGRTTGGSDGGASTSTTGGGGDTGASEQAPVCNDIGGGKYNCNVWSSAKSYTAAGAEAGVLNAGTNYFFCQQNLGRRETHGQWTNVWWAKTDDDSGNTGVFVSVVYLKGGDNDKPLPGLPVC
ncbi:MAG TPA: serine/threonine protein kinase, partial [Streptomyces sp.]|nr:serine/threonine protein kinase [Streptomyces sp.]